MWKVLRRNETIDIYCHLPPRSWMERVFNVERWTTMTVGGHFAALEQPDLLAEEMRASGRCTARARRGGPHNCGFRSPVRGEDTSVSPRANACKDQEEALGRHKRPRQYDPIYTNGIDRTPGSAVQRGRDEALHRGGRTTDQPPQRTTVIEQRPA